MSESDWVDALSADELPTDHTCSHGQARPCDGFLEGHEIECPPHQGRFDVRDGRPLCEPASEALRSYPVEVQASRVWLRFD